MWRSARRLGPSSRPFSSITSPVTTIPTSARPVSGLTSSRAARTVAVGPVLRPHERPGQPWPEVLPRSPWAGAPQNPPHPGPGHPWPVTPPRSRYGGARPSPWSTPACTPDTVVELVVDPALDGPRWRHPTRLVRLRPDLQAADLLGAALGSYCAGEQRIRRRRT